MHFIQTLPVYCGFFLKEILFSSDEVDDSCLSGIKLGAHAQQDLLISGNEDHLL